MVESAEPYANAVIADAVAQYFGIIHFFGVVDPFEGHNLCAGWATTNEWINGLSLAGGDTIRFFRIAHSFHPHRAGHAAEAELLADLVKGLPWPNRPTGTITLGHDGLTVTSAGQRTVAEFGQLAAPVGPSVEQAISIALGKPSISASAAEYGMCSGKVDRLVGWEEQGQDSAALVVALTGSGTRPGSSGIEATRARPSSRWPTGCQSVRSSSGCTWSICRR